MATVTFSGDLQQFTDAQSVQLEARVYRDMIAELEGLYPGLKESKLREMAVAIDGEIIVDPLLEAIEVDSEIYFFHFVSGG